MRVMEIEPQILQQFLLDNDGSCLEQLIPFLSTEHLLKVVSGSALQLDHAVQERLLSLEPYRLRAFMLSENKPHFLSAHLTHPELRACICAPLDKKEQKTIKKLFKEPAGETVIISPIPPNPVSLDKKTLELTPSGKVQGTNDEDTGLFLSINNERYLFSDNETVVKESTHPAEQISFFYSIDGNGNKTINCNNPAHSEMVYLFIKKHSQRLCIQFASRFPIAMQYLIDYCKETKPYIEPEILTKIVPYMSDNDLLDMLCSPHKLIYSERRDIQNIALSESFLVNYGRMVPSEVLARLSLLRPLSFGKVLPKVFHEFPIKHIDIIDSYALLSFFHHVNSQTLTLFQQRASLNKVLIDLTKKGHTIDDSALSYIISHTNNEELYSMLMGPLQKRLMMNETVHARALAFDFIEHLARLPNELIKELLLTNGPHFNQASMLIRLPSFDNRRLCQLINLDAAEILFCNIDIRKRCTSPAFQEYLGFLNPRKLACLFEQYKDEAQVVVPVLLKQCDAETIVNLMTLSPLFFQLEEVTAHFLASGMAERYLQRLTDDHVRRILETHPDAIKIRTFQERILTFHDAELIEHLIALSSKEVLIECVRNVIDQHLESQEIPHPLENPHVQKRFLEDDLLTEFIEHAPELIFIEAVFRDTSLWLKEPIKNHLSRLSSRALGHEELTIMNDYCTILHPLICSLESIFTSHQFHLQSLLGKLQVSRALISLKRYYFSYRKHFPHQEGIPPRPLLEALLLKPLPIEALCPRPLPVVIVLTTLLGRLPKG